MKNLFTHGGGGSRLTAPKGETREKYLFHNTSICIYSCFRITSMAFTLAEVLITLGIIGVVAALTMPSVMNNVQKMVMKNQFKKSYSLVQQAWKKAEADLDYKPDCYYWNKIPYTVPPCVEWNIAGNCKQYETPLPSNYMGNMSECTIFMSAIEKNLKVIKKCVGNGYRDGCIPDYEGLDSLKGQSDSSLSDEYLEAATSGCAYFRKNEIKNSRTIYVLADGTLIFPYVGPQLFALDINGKKGPNKWGHDLFTFQTMGGINEPLQIKGGGCMTTEKGGMSTVSMIDEINK